MKLRYLTLSATAALIISCTDVGNNNTENLATNNPVTTVTTTETKPGKPKVFDGIATSITGSISGMEAGKKIFFDRKTLDATDVKGTTLINEEGRFDLTSGVKAAGIFRIRLGARPIWMLLEGGEK